MKPSYKTTAIDPTRERPVLTFSGVAMVVLAIALVALEIYAIVAVRSVALIILLALGIMLVLPGFYMLQPNAAAALMFFGKYQGTDRTTGPRWTWPWNMRKKISLRVRNMTSETLKVNDKRGNPIEIAANVVWHVEDTAQALFDVEDFESFVRIQVESAIRHMASHYAYDHGEDDELTLRASADEVAQALQDELQNRVAMAGVAIDETKLTHLAYAPEIAGAMLRRQQAEAVLAARQKIVAGAVTMVEMALKHLSESNVVELDDERRAAMVSNLMVVLCSERDTQPIVNTGTLYP